MKKNVRDEIASAKQILDSIELNYIHALQKQQEAQVDYDQPMVMCDQVTIKEPRVAVCVAVALSRLINTEWFRSLENHFCTADPCLECALIRRLKNFLASQQDQELKSDI